MGQGHGTKTTVSDRKRKSDYETPTCIVYPDIPSSSDKTYVRRETHNMGNIAFRLLLTFNATSLLVIIFCIQNNFSVKYFYPHPVTVGMPDYLSYLAYTIAPVLLTWLSLALSSFLGKDEFKEGETETIEHANNSFLPSYLGYFFVALSISDWQALIFVYGILFIFTFLSQALYFNPIFLLFGYEFYNVKTQSGTTIFLISRERYKKPSTVIIPVARRINDYTFIERR